MEKKKYTDSSNILLTPEEEAEALQTALTKKRAVEEHKLFNRYDELLHSTINRPMCQNEVLNWMRYYSLTKYGKEIVIDSSNHDVIKKLSKYFANDPSVEKEGVMLHKGIMLCGGVGTGKTTIMEAFASNQRYSFKMIPTRRIADMYSEIGNDLLRKYVRSEDSASTIDSFWKKQIGYCFDDLGTERVGKRYADSANVMAEIFLNRYDNKATWFNTHITTNLNGDEIEEMYGSRVRSRLREQYNVLVLNGDDRRR